MGKKVQDQIPQTEVNQVPNAVFLVEGQGIPLGITVDGANRHDMKMTKATLQSIVVCRPHNHHHHHHHHLQQIPNNNTSVLTRVMTTLKYTSYLKNMVIPFMFAREEEKTYNNGNKKKKRRRRIPKYRARRWVVERTHSWMNRFRRLLIRWEKKEDNYIAILHFVCAWITYKRGGVFG